MSRLSYALITPAKNEAAFLERTINSVLAQTRRPLRWVIVDDNSTDGTSEIVRRFAQRYDFIQLATRRREAAGRSFANKVHAFNAGLKELGSTAYDFVGNLDADMSLPPQYYANMLAAFEECPQLGLVGGTVYCNIGSHYDTDDTTEDSVGGAIQLFRRACFEQIGGYAALECGGIDAAAEIMARMHGWRVTKIPDNPAFEQRLTGSTQHGVLRGRFEEGVQFRRLGYGFGFYLIRCLYRLNVRPAWVSSLLSVSGYLYSAIRGDSICLPPEVVEYLRTEQYNKLRHGLAVIRKRPSLLCPHQRLSSLEE